MAMQIYKEMRKSVIFWGNQSGSESRCSQNNAMTASCDATQADQD